MAKRRSIITARVSQLTSEEVYQAQTEKMKKVIDAYIDPDELDRQRQVIQRNREAQASIREMDDLLESITNPHYGQMEYRGKWYPKDIVRQIRKIEREYQAEWNKPIIEMTRQFGKKKATKRPLIPVDIDELYQRRDTEISQLIEAYEIDVGIRKPKISDDDIGYKTPNYDWWTQHWISRLTPAFVEANKRIKKLIEEGLTSTALVTIQSYGYLNADNQLDINELRADLEDAGKSGIYTLQHLNAVITQFLNDEGSTPEGAIHEMALEAQRVYGGKFGKEWVDKGGKTWDTSVIKEMHLERVFELYRKIEELPDNAALIGTRYQAGVYGSDNLIEFIYDLVTEGYDNDDVLDIVQKELDNYAEQTREHFYTRKKELNSFTATSDEFGDFLSRLEW